MSKFTYEMVQRFIDLGMKTITLKWNEVDPAWKTLVHERLFEAGYDYLFENGNLRKYYYNKKESN